MMRHATSRLIPRPRRRRFGTGTGLIAGALAVTTTLTMPATAGPTSSSTRTRSMTQTTASAATQAVTETTLDNGLTVLIQEVHTAPVATFMVWYRVGSRNETAGITGVSHLLEHMMFKGTPTLAKGEIAKILQKNGAAFNAGTSLDYTNYYEVLASDRLELAMRIESDRMRNATIPEEEHRLEMTVVRSELERNEDNPHRALYLEAMAQAFKAHPYHWPTIGWRTDVEQIRTSQIRDYYKTYYVPNNATVVVVGDVDRAATLAMVKRYFGSIPRGPEPPAVSTVEPPQLGERRFKIRKPGDTSYFLAVFRNAALHHPDTYALDVLGIILGHGKTSRLYQSLVEKKLATEVDASNDTGRDPLLFTAQATVAEGSSLAKVEEALFREIERLKSEPITAQEVTRAKKQVEASFVYSKDSIRSLAQQLGYYNTVGSWRYLESYLDRVRAVTAADLQRVARTYLTEDARTVGWYDPTPQREAAAGADGKRDGVSTPAQLLEAGADSAPTLRFGGSRIVANYRPSEAEASEADSPSRRADPSGVGDLSAAPAVSAGAAPTRSAPAYRTVLPNGLTLIVRRNAANPTISLQGLVKAGGIFDPIERSGLAGFVAAMLDQGTAKRTALQTAEAIENVGAHLGFDGGSETVSFSATMLADDLAAVLDVLADALQRPSFPAENIEKIRSERITDYRVAESSTASVAARRANQLLYPSDHPYHRYPLGNDTTLAAITREDLTSFHARHYGPERTIIVLVGDVEAKRATELIRAAFGGWKKLENAPELRVPKAPAPSTTLQLTVPMKGKSQTDVVYATPGLERTARDYDAAMIMSYILGGGSLSSRLMTSLRDEQGLVYGVYSSLASGIGAGPLSIRAGTNPANAERAVASILEQVRRMVDEGPTEAEMTDAKDYLTGVFPVRLETNAGVAGQLLSAELYGLGLDYIERYTSIVRGVTREQAAAAARAYLRPQTGYALVTAGSVPTPGGTPSGP
jgi:zinc protease